MSEKTIQECLDFLLPRNEVQINMMSTGGYFVAIRPYDMGALWYFAKGPLYQALNEACENKLAAIGRARA